LGEHPIQIDVADATGGVSQTFTLPVADRTVVENLPPEFTSTPRTSIGFATPYLYEASATDANNDPLSFSLDGAPVGMTIGEASGLVNWTPAADQFGVNAVNIVVSDGRGGTARQSFDVEVTAQSENQFPTITSDPKAVAVADASYIYDAMAIDPDGDPLVWSLKSAGRYVDRSGAGDRPLDSHGGSARRSPSHHRSG
jgi:hypothetical protein